MLPLFIGLVAAASGAAVLESQADFSLLEHFRAYQQRQLPSYHSTPIELDGRASPVIPGAAADADAAAAAVVVLSEDEDTDKDGSSDVNKDSAADDDDDGEDKDAEANWAERNQSTVIAAAVAVPLALLGMAGLSAYVQRSRTVDEDSESIDSAFGMRRTIDDEDESSVGGLTEDGFQSKFEVGNDAAMWAKQADFSAF